MSRTIITRTAEETIALAETLARELHGGELIAFRGGLGSGKTTFCRGLAIGLGSEDPVSSPTFSLVNYYRGPIPLAHFDAWRITGEDDLEAAGFYDYQAAGAVVAVEWSERIAGLLEEPYIRVAMEKLPDGNRQIDIRMPGETV